jgi:TP901 family phage tail tape measure protein
MQAKTLSFGKLVGSIMTAKVLSRGFAYAEQGFASLTESIITADQALTSASAKFGPSVKRGTTAYKELEAISREVGATTEFTMKETAEGLDFLAMAGFNYKQSIAAIKPLTDLATASQMDLARASDIASDALGAFQLSMEPDVIEANLNRVNDVFARAVTSRNVTMETMFDTMKHGGAAVATGGGDIETFAALTGEMGGAGIKGTKAGTTLKNMYVNLSVAAAKAGTAGGRALRKLGVEFRDPKNKKNLNDVVTILEQLDEKTRDLGDIKRTKIIKDIFGKIALPGVKSLLSGDVIGRLREYRDTMYESSGASKEMAAEMRTGLGSQLKILKSALTAKGMNIFEQLMGGKDPAESVAKLIEKVRDFDVTPIVTGLKAAFDYVKGTVEILYKHRDTIGLLMKVFTGFKLLSGVANVARGTAGMAGGFGAIGGAGGAAGMAGALGGGGAAGVSTAAAVQAAIPVVLGVWASAAVALAIGGVIGTLISNYMNEQEKKADLAGRKSGDTALDLARGGAAGKLSLSENLKAQELVSVQMRAAMASNDKWFGGMSDYEFENVSTNLSAAMKRLQDEETKLRGVQRQGSGFGTSFSEGMSIDPALQAEQAVGMGIVKGFGSEFIESLRNQREKEFEAMRMDSNMGITVQINGLPEGASAEATVDRGTPKVNRNATGVR